jgi:hypothetical protein
MMVSRVASGERKSRKATAMPLIPKMVEASTIVFVSE